MRDWIKNKKAEGKLPLIDKRELGKSYVEDTALNRYESEGAKIPTSVKVEYKGRKRRLYSAHYPDVEAMYVVVNDQPLFLDDATAHKVLAKAEH